MAPDFRECPNPMITMVAADYEPMESSDYEVVHAAAKALKELRPPATEVGPALVGTLENYREHKEHHYSVTWNGEPVPGGIKFVD